MLNGQEITVLVGLVFTALGGGSWFWYDKKATSKNLDELKKEVSNQGKQLEKHSSIFITETRARDISKEEIDPIRQTISEIRSEITTMSKSLNDLVTEIRVINAVQSVKDKEG